MEASERPQLSLDQDDADGHVRALGDRLVVESLTVEDARAAKLVRERAKAGHPPAQTVRDAIEHGARLLEREGTAIEADYVRRELEAGLGELDSKLGGTLEEGAEALSERIATAFGAERNDSVQAQIKEIVTQEARQQREQLFAALTAEDASNPLNGMQIRIGQKIVETETRHTGEVEKLRDTYTNESRALQRQVSELKEALAREQEREEADERVAEEAERGTAKGRTFEERVYVELEAIAAARGDCAHHVGDEEAIGGGKRGDVVVELDAANGPASGAIVFEVKDERRKGMREAWGILNDALAQRQADFAVLVVAGVERVPTRADQLHQYEGNKLIIAVDRDDPGGVELQAAYNLARALVRARRDTSLEVDAAGVLEAAEAITNELRRKQGMKRALSGIVKNAESVGSTLDEMDEGIRAQITVIESLIEAAEAEPAD